MNLTPLIKQLQESGSAGAVIAGDVAAHATPMLSGFVRRGKSPKIKIKQIVFNKPTMGIKESFMKSIKEYEEIQIPDALAKLQSLEKAAAAPQNVATFGLEDEDGNLVKVTVPSEQGSEFELALQRALKADDDTNVEIAEVIFDLKDRFDIIDVEWGNMVEDEEDIDPSIGGEQTPDDVMPGEELPIEEPAPTDNTEDVSSLLTQVIDMMRADAEAREADANARIADAEAKEAEYSSIQAAAKVRQEEQILDMTSHENEQKEASKEAKRLAKLAKWKHELANSNNTEREDMEHLIPSYDDVSDNDGTGGAELDIKPTHKEENEERSVKSSLATLLINRLGK